MSSTFGRVLSLSDSLCYILLQLKHLCVDVYGVSWIECGSKVWSHLDFKYLLSHTTLKSISRIWKKGRSCGSIRVSNELGAGHPRTAKISMIVASFTSLLFGILLALVLLVCRSKFPLLFTNSKEVQKVVHELTPLLAVTVFINSLQPTLSGTYIRCLFKIFLLLNSCPHYK